MTLTLTLGEWIFLSIGIIIGIICVIFAMCSGEHGAAIFILLITIVCAGVFIGGINWYHTHTASGAREYKDYQSNIQGGLNREITITAEDGREIFHYEGKVDIETNNDNYILFESEEGQRYIIYYGVQDTVLIVEKRE